MHRYKILPLAAVIASAGGYPGNSDPAGAWFLPGGSPVFAAESLPARKGSLQAPVVTPAQEGYLKRALKPQQRAELASMSHLLARSPSYATIQHRWTRLIRQLGSDSGGQVDIDALVQQVIRDSYLETSKALKSYAGRVKHFNEMKKKLRAQLKQARRQRAGTPAPEQSQEVSPSPATHLTPPHPPPSIAAGDANIHHLESQLRTTGYDANLAELDLQSQVQKQQQMLQMLSNISKLMHDTAMSIIRKIGG